MDGLIATERSLPVLDEEERKKKVYTVVIGVKMQLK
jgi:hypothetical protein